MIADYKYSSQIMFYLYGFLRLTKTQLQGSQIHQKKLDELKRPNPSKISKYCSR